MGVFAKTIGIAVDSRRTNKSLESLQANVARLKTYKAKLVLVPRGAEAKRGMGGCVNDATPDQLQAMEQTNMRAAMPVVQDKLREKGMKITKDMKDFACHKQIRQEWSNKRHAGKREARAKMAAENITY